MRNLLTMGLVALLASGAWAAASDTVTISLEVKAIHELNIAAASLSLVVSAAVAGAEPTQAAAATTYDITNNSGTVATKITGALDTAMPVGLTLRATAAAPTGATSIPAVPMTAVAADLVTGVAKVAQTGLVLGFTLDALSTAGVVAPATKTFTMTLVSL